MYTMRYPATFRPDDAGRPVVRFRDLPEAMTDGKDEAEALTEAADCLGSALAHRVANREEIPLASAPRRGERLVDVPLWLAPKLALYLAMRDAGISNSELARRLGCRETVVRRMLNPDHASRAGSIERALAALGKRLSVTMEDAA